MTISNEVTHQPTGDLCYEQCKVCEDGIAHLSFETRVVEYGPARSACRIEVRVPTFSCDACGMSYLRHDAEELQHTEVCKAMGRLTPREIQTIREIAGLSQASFAAELDVGIASLKRWELGTAIQDKRNDLLLRGFASSTPRVQRKPVFRTEINEMALARARRFRLRLPRTEMAASPVMMVA